MRVSREGGLMLSQLLAECKGRKNEHFKIKRFGFLRSKNFIVLNQIEIQYFFCFV